MNQCNTPPRNREKNRRRICLILPYFGKLPPYWGGFLDSCADNSDIDFLIVSDCSIDNPPENVRCVSLSWHDMQKRVKSVFQQNGIKRTCISYPYKLCDYKPAYGLIFAEYLIGYDYWGYIDCDLVFGNLSAFLNKIGIDSYDRIHRAGHLSIYRNSDEINHLFLAQTDGVIAFHDVADSSMIYNYDESGTNEIFLKKGLRFYNHGHDATFAHYYYPFRWKNTDMGTGELFVKEADGSTKVYRELANGKVLCEEVNYIHYMSKKDVSIQRGMERPFCITHNGVFPIAGMSHLEAIRKYTLSSDEEQERFLRKLKTDMRVASVKKVIREIRYKKLHAFAPIFRRLRPWLSSLKFMPNK